MNRTHHPGRHKPGARRAAPKSGKRAAQVGAVASALVATSVMVGAGTVLKTGADEPVDLSMPPTPDSETRRATVARPMTFEALVPDQGTGHFKTARTDGPSTGPQPLRYSVEVEGGLDVSPAKFAKAVDATLADPRGWRGIAEYEFERVEQGQEVRVLLATPETVDVLCAPLQTDGEVSCRNQDRVVINAKRWFFGAEPFNRPLRAYRRYVVNHEVGHALGYPHQPCPAPGEVAPVMLQQTLGLDACTANPWPVAGPPPEE